MKVIVMCGKYDDFDPKIDKKVDFFHYISIGRKWQWFLTQILAKVWITDILHIKEMWQASGKPKLLTKGIFDPKIGKKVDFSTKTPLAAKCNGFWAKFGQKYVWWSIGHKRNVSS